MPEKFIPPTDAIEEEKFIPPSDAIVKEVKKKEDTTPTSKSVSTSSNTASKSTSQNQNKAPIGTIQAGQNPNTYGIGNVLPITEEQKKAGKELLGQGTKIAETTKKQTTSENKNTYPTPQELLKQSGGIGSDVTKDLKQKVDIKAKQIEQFGTKTEEQKQKEKEIAEKKEFDNQIDQMLVAESSVFGNENVKDNILDYFEINLKANDLENRLSKEDKALYETINKVDDFRNKLTLLDTQYKNGDLSEFTYKQQYDNVKKELSTLEYQATNLIEQRNKDIESEIKSLKTQLANGKKEVVGTTNVSGGVGTLGTGLGSYTQQVSLSENDRKEIQKQIKILEAKKGLFTDNIKQQEQIDSFKPEIAKLKEKKIIPDGANVKESIKILYARKHKQLQSLIEKSFYEGNPFQSSQKGIFNKAKEFIADIVANNKGYTEVAGYENIARQYLIEDKTSKEIYKLQEELNTLAPIIALNRYGTYKNDSEWAKFGKTFTQSLIPTKQGKILTETEIAQNTQKIINDLGLREIKGVTEKDIQDNKYSVGEMLGTTGAFMVQFSIPTGGGQAMALVKGISALTKVPKLIKIADKVNDVVNYTQKSRIGRFLKSAVEEGVKYEVKGQVYKGVLGGEADFVSGLSGVLGEKVMSKLVGLFGKKLPDILKPIERLLGKGFGESGEESMQTIWQVYKESENFEDFKNTLGEQFGTLKDVQHFVLSTALMGMAFGVSGELSKAWDTYRKKAIDKLKKEGKYTEEDEKQVNEILKDLTQEHETAVNDEIDNGVTLTDEEVMQMADEFTETTEVDGEEMKVVSKDEDKAIVLDETNNKLKQITLLAQGKGVVSTLTNDKINIANKLNQNIELNADEQDFYNNYKEDIEKIRYENQNAPIEPINTGEEQINSTGVSTETKDDTGLGTGNEQTNVSDQKEIQQDNETEKQIAEVKQVIQELEANPNSPFAKLVNLDEQKQKLAELEKKKQENALVEQKSENKVVNETLLEQPTVLGKEVEDAEYNEFIDKGKVSEERLNDIANKVKNREPLSDREKEIFTDKTSEINKIIAGKEVGSVGRDVRTENDFANENESYRVIVGDEAFNDIVKSGVVRTNADSKGTNKEEAVIDLSGRPTAFPSFSKGSASMSYAKDNPNHYIIVTEDASIQPSKSGRHGKGKTMFPTDENGNHLKELSGEKVKVYKHIGEGKYELVYANGKSLEQSLPPQEAKAEQPISKKETTENPALANVEEKTSKQKQFKEELLKRGLPEAGAEGSSKLLVKALTDKNTALNILDIANKNIRELWSKETGVELPKTQNGTREAIENYFKSDEQKIIEVAGKRASELYDNDLVKLANGDANYIYENVPEATFEIAELIVETAKEKLIAIGKGDLIGGKIQNITKSEQPTSTTESEVEAKKADIEIGKVGNTEYEVKVDGVYYQGKKLDNPKNLSHKELIEGDIRRRQEEELKNSKIQIPRYFTFKELGGAKGKSGKALSSIESDRNEEIQQDFESKLQEGDKLIEPNGDIYYFKNGKVVKSNGQPRGMDDIGAFINGVTIDRTDKINTKYDAELKAVESLLSKEQTPPALRDVESTAKALEGKKLSLDEKAKKLGYIGIKQFNAQNQLNENLTDEEKALLQEYSDFQQEIKNLKDENVIAKLSDDEFSTWSKANDITRDDLGKVVKDEEIELAAKRIRILNARGDSKKAESELKKLKESKKKDNWTKESWKERFDEDIEQSEIDEINSSNKEFNKSVDKAVESLLSKEQSTSTEDIEAKKADIERRKQALRDIMEATGEWMFINGVTDGTFMGEGLLNMNENGDVVLTRYADSEEGLTKGKGKTKNLKDIAGQFGGEQIATSGVEGGLASFANGVVGEYHIPLQELIDLIKSEDVVFAGLGNKEFVLSPHIADKYLAKINGKEINAKYDAELKAVESLLSKEQTPQTKSETPPDDTYNIVSASVKTNISEGRKKVIVEIDEKGNQSVKEIEFTKEDAEVELDRLEALAQRGKLTPSEFIGSYFGQSTDTGTLSKVKENIKNDAVGFIEKLRKSFEAKLESLLSKEQPTSTTETESEKKVEKTKNQSILEKLINKSDTIEDFGEELSKLPENEKQLIIEELNNWAIENGDFEDKGNFGKFPKYGWFTNARNYFKSYKNNINLDSQIYDKKETDTNEQQLRDSKLTEQDNIEQEPIIKIIEGKAEGNNEAELNEVIQQVDELVNNATDVVNVPIADIKTNESEYQGRKNKFSERSANNVANNFDKNKFDPIVVYKHSDGNTYVLSGHSRLAGMKRRNEKTIPARYFKGTDAQAKEFALNSNKLGTLQTDLENADYYRKKLQEGASYNALLQEAKANEQEGSASRIVDYAYLSINGKTYQALEALQKGEGDSASNIKIIAQKIGRIKNQNDHLTTEHENELFEYMLQDKENIPTDKELADPNNTLNRSINAVKFNNKEPLNLNKFTNKSNARVQWEAEKKELEQQIAEIKKDVNPSKKTGWTGLKEKAIASLAKNNSKEAIEKAENDFNNNINGINDNYKKLLEKKRQELTALSNKLAKHLLAEKNLIEGEKNQGSLFQATDKGKFTKLGKETFDKFAKRLKAVFPKIKLNTFTDWKEALGVSQEQLDLMFQVEEDYRGWHKAPVKEGKNSLDDMSDIFPDDLYSINGFRYYADDKNGKADRESYEQILKSRNKPNRKVKVYRAVPKGINKINSGDWVSLSKTYAKKHGENHIQGEYDILEIEIEASKLFNEGSINEFGVQFLRTPNGTVYGFVKDGQVFINENELNANTLVHEYGHIFAQILKAQYPTAHKNLIDRIKQEKALIEAKKKDQNYANLTTEQLADEVLNELIGNKGETILNTKKPIHKEILDLLNRFWNRLKNIFTTGSPNIAKWSVEQFQNATIDDIVNNVTADLLSGRKLSDMGSDMLGGKSKFQLSKSYLELIEGFYSPLEKIINETKFEKLPAKQWIDKFAKGEEAKWTGLTEWLSQQQGSVSKADIQKYLKDNRIQVVEVVKGEDMPNYKLEVEPPSELGADRMDLLGDLGKAGNLDNPRFREYLNKKYGKNGNKIYDWLAENATVEGTYSKDTKFSQYQLEGEKENYKEILVTLPSKNKFDANKVKIKKNYNSATQGTFDIYYDGKLVKGGYDLFNNGSGRFGEKTDTELSETAKRIIETGDKFNKVENAQGNFISSHFDEPNILVHLRMNTRTDAEGNKVLFLEEVQSDWGQKGKKEGFAANETERQKIKDKINEKGKEYDALPNKDKWESKGDDIQFEISELNKQLTKLGYGSMPQAPFVTDTNAWTKLGLKVALKEAVKQGADKIAWTTGEQQNDRYDLSKQVDVVDAKRNKDGSYEVEATKDGSKIFGKSDMSLREIEDTFGKDVAQKINDSKSPLINISGDNLKAGGKGMKGFYGSPTEGSLGIVGNVAKSLFKQEVGTIKINTGVDTNEKEIQWTEDSDGIQIVEVDGERIEFNTEKDAQDYINKLKLNTSTQHSIDITPELKASVEGGLPLFQIKDNQKETKNLLQNVIDNGINIDDLINYWKENNFDFDEQNIRDTYAELTQEVETKLDEEIKENSVESTDDSGGKTKKKTLVYKRIYTDKKTTQEEKEALEKLGLDYEVESQTKVANEVIRIIDEIGLDGALAMARSGELMPSYRNYIYAKVLEDLRNRIFIETDEEQRKSLIEERTFIANELDIKLRNEGRGGSIMKRAGADTMLNYDVAWREAEFKEEFDKEISKETKEKLLELEKRLAEQEAKIRELEEKQKNFTADDTIKAIKSKGKKRTASYKAKVLADRFRKLKTKPLELKDANGNPINITLNSVVSYNEIIEIGAKIIEKGGQLLEAINEVLKKLEEQEWFQKLNDNDKKAIERQITDHLSIDDNIDEDIKIPKDLLYDLVEKGLEINPNYSIDNLVDDVIETLGLDVADKREIRDKITNYGEEIKMPEGKVHEKLRELKRIGKLLSGIEDLEQGQLPKRSGLQRDETTTEERRLRQIINEKLKEIQKSDEVLESEWKSALDKLKTRYKKRIEDLKAQIDAKEKTIKEKNVIKLDDDALKLKTELSEVLKAYKEMFGNNELSAEARIKMRENALKKQIADTQNRIEYIKEKGKDVEKKKPSKVESDLISTLEQNLAKEKKELLELQKTKGLIDKKKIELAKARVEKQIAEYERRIKEKDFSKKEKYVLPFDEELNKAKLAKYHAKKEFDTLFYREELKNRSMQRVIYDFILDLINTPKSLKATLDLSAPLRQGATLLLSNNKEFRKAFIEMHKMAKNKDYYDNFLADLEQSEDYILIKDSGLVITDVDGKLEVKEETFMLGLVNKIPILKIFNKASERGYSGFLNSLRVGVFRDGVEQLKKAGITFENNPKAYKALANFVNNATGRGELTTSEGTNKLLNTLFFSPRMITSRIGMIYTLFDPDAPMVVKKMSAKSLASFALYVSVVNVLGTILVNALDDDDDDDELKDKLNKNPLATDFLKVKYDDTRYDITAGYSTIIRTLARFIKGERINSQGKIKELDGSGYYGETRWSEIGAFFSNKFAPTTRVLYNVSTGKHPEDYYKTIDDATTKDYLKALFVPIGVESLYEDITDKEKEELKIATDFLLNFYGVSVQKY